MTRQARPAPRGRRPPPSAAFTTSAQSSIVAPMATSASSRSDRRGPNRVQRMESANGKLVAAPAGRAVDLARASHGSRRIHPSLTRLSMPPCCDRPQWLAAPHGGRTHRGSSYHHSAPSFRESPRSRRRPAAAANRARPQTELSENGWRLGAALWRRAPAGRAVDLARASHRMKRNTPPKPASVFQCRPWQ